MSGRPELAALAIADPPQRWRALGFDVADDGGVALGGVELGLGGEGRGITGWTLRHVPADLELGGLATAVTSAPAVASIPHPNGANGIDHVVIVTPEFDAMATALDRAQMPLRRLRDAGGGLRQGFRRLGCAIMELVEAPAAPATAFWGLTVVVADLDALGVSLGSHLDEIHDAVQPGRRIATLARSAGLSARVAFIDPE